MTRINSFEIRSATVADILQLCVILNEIIQIGGTTAMEFSLSSEDFESYYMNGPNCLSCLIAAGENGILYGFQALSTNSKLPNNCADIATFARQTPKISGVGTELFKRTVNFAKAAGFSEINATIRADNVPGLAYYSKIGFQHHSIAKDTPLLNGIPVDRISKRYTITSGSGHP